MALNPKQNLVIIKGKDHTEDILRVAQEAGRIPRNLQKWEIISLCPAQR